MRSEQDVAELGEAMTVRVGHGFDAHRLVEGRPLVLGGVHVPFERGALGHSDGDALAHAAADALLGAAALPDLGARFPASDPRWKDADSMVLLAQCAAAVREAGYDIGNVDATIVLDQPKLGGFHRRDAREDCVVSGSRCEPRQRESKTQRRHGVYGRRHRRGRLCRRSLVRIRRPLSKRCSLSLTAWVKLLQDGQAFWKPSRPTYGRLSSATRRLALGSTSCSPIPGFTRSSRTE